MEQEKNKMSIHDISPAVRMEKIEKRMKGVKSL